MFSHSRKLVNRPSLSRNLLLTICFYGIFGIYTELQAMSFSTLAEPLGEMFNSTLFYHYRVIANSAGVSLVSSSMTMAIGVGVFLSTVLVLPRLDSRGRKFVTVYIRFVVGASVAILQMMAGLTNSAELYLLGQFFLGLSIPCTQIATGLYLTECAPDKSRGLVSTSLQFGNLIGSLLMYFLSGPNVFGNRYKWPVIPAITLILAIVMFLATFALPDSPRWLISKGQKEKARDAVAFFHGPKADVDAVLLECIEEQQLTVQEKLSPREVWSDDTLRTAMKLIVSSTLFLSLSLVPVEGLYTVAIQTKMGLTVDQSMQMNFIIHLLFAPLRLFGTVLIDRYGRRFVLFLAAIFSYSKILLMFTAQFLVFLGAPAIITVWMVVVNEVLSELYGSTGVGALSTLLVAELIPPAARVSSAQITFIGMFITGMPLTALFPLFNSTFAPAFYVPMMLLQPLLVLYLYKNLPETAAKTVCDIVHGLDDDVRSRANTTRRQSVLAQRDRLLTNLSIQSYNSINI